MKQAKSDVALVEAFASSSLFKEDDWFEIYESLLFDLLQERPFEKLPKKWKKFLQSSAVIEPFQEKQIHPHHLLFVQGQDKQMQKSFLLRVARENERAPFGKDEWLPFCKTPFAFSFYECCLELLKIKEVSIEDLLALAKILIDLSLYLLKEQPKLAKGFQIKTFHQKVGLIAKLYQAQKVEDWKELLSSAVETLMNLKEEKERLLYTFFCEHFHLNGFKLMSKGLEGASPSDSFFCHNFCWVIGLQSDFSEKPEKHFDDLLHNRVAYQSLPIPLLFARASRELPKKISSFLSAMKKERKIVELEKKYIENKGGHIDADLLLPDAEKDFVRPAYVFLLEGLLEFLRDGDSTGISAEDKVASLKFASEVLVKMLTLIPGSSCSEEQSESLRVRNMVVSEQISSLVAATGKKLMAGGEITLKHLKEYWPSFAESWPAIASQEEDFGLFFITYLHKEGAEAGIMEILNSLGSLDFLEEYSSSEREDSLKRRPKALERRSVYRS